MQVVRWCAVMILWAGTGLAQDQASADLDCEAAETQADLTQCAQIDLATADADLNDAYAAAMAALAQMETSVGQQGAVATLKAAERAWIDYRDQSCAAEGWMYRGGSIEPLIVIECQTRLTQARADDLWTMTEAQDSSDP